MLSAVSFKSEFFAGNFVGNFEQTPPAQDGFFSLPFLGHAFKEKEVQKPAHVEVKSAGVGLNNAI